MKFIKTGLLTMLVSLFILESCKNPSGVGLDVDPSIALNSSLIDTSTVLTKLMKQDSVLANFTSTSALAYFKDPIFGTTTSNIAVALILPATSLSFKNNTVLDSAVLVLPFVGFYGDSLNTNYNVEVRQLNEVLFNERAKTYFNTKKWVVNNTVVGSKNFAPRFRDSILLQDIIVGKKDTIKKVPAQLRIRLDKTFITNLILKADSAKLSTNTAFNNLIKGFYISLNKASTTNNGGVFTFDTNNPNVAKIDLFYKKTSITGIIDTLSSSLAIQGGAGYAVSEVTWDFNGTAVQTELQSNNKSSTNLYFKGLSGTQVKVDFPYLQKLKTLGTNISINRAELILKVVNGTETPYKPMARLRIFRWDIAERILPIPDESPVDPRSLPINYGVYNKTNKSYTFNVTAYIQDLLNGRTKNYGTFITSVDFSGIKQITPTLIGYTRGLEQPGRTVVGGANPSFKTQLKIYYTDLK
jgi:hypothetical protein